MCNVKKIIQPTLQVRIPRRSWPAGRGASDSVPAGLTVEAALVLPVLLFAAAVLMAPFRILDVERQMQAIVTSVGEEISEMAYVRPGDDVRDTGKTVGNAFVDAAAAYAYAEGMIRVKAGSLPVSDLSLARSQILDDGENIEIVADYRMRLPYSLFGLGDVSRTSCCYLRAWVGRDGGCGEGDPSGENGEDPIVYVGKESTRYHIRADCHYLYNQLTEVFLDQIENYRNESGGRYAACARCASGDRKTGASTVFIMPSGTHYHTSASCTAIIAYVTAVRRSEVEYLGACSYCFRK